MKGEKSSVLAAQRTIRAVRFVPARTKQSIGHKLSLRGRGQSNALGINDHGWVVGYTTEGTTQRAFVFDGTRMIALKNNTWTARCRLATLWKHRISTTPGKSSATGWYNDNQAFLLTPVIPEPHTAGVAALGAMLIIHRMRAGGREPRWKCAGDRLS